MKYNFREITSNDLFFVQKKIKPRVFEGNRIVKFKPSNVLLTTLSIVAVFLSYQFL
jgi:hypothetical protein